MESVWYIGSFWLLNFGASHNLLKWLYYWEAAPLLRNPFNTCSYVRAV